MKRMAGVVLMSFNLLRVQKGPCGRFKFSSCWLWALQLTSANRFLAAVFAQCDRQRTVVPLAAPTLATATTANTAPNARALVEEAGAEAAPPPSSLATTAIASRVLTAATGTTIAVTIRTSTAVLRQPRTRHPARHLARGKISMWKRSTAPPVQDPAP